MAQDVYRRYLGGDDEEGDLPGAQTEAEREAERRRIEAEDAQMRRFGYDLSQLREQPPEQQQEAGPAVDYAAGNNLNYQRLAEPQQQEPVATPAPENFDQ